MKASVGDGIIVKSTRLGGAVREGRIVDERHADGSPPYLVEWADHGQPVLVCPGPDAHLMSTAHPGGADAAAGPLAAQHVRSWQVRVDLFEAEDEISAHAVLITQAPAYLDARGTAASRSSGQEVAEIADEIAARGRSGGFLIG
jgi:Domain of unknown function (DUF1918)/Domain of unknown function (DUF1876)